MINPEQLADAKRWLRYAEEDLALAEEVLKEKRFAARFACLHSQQAAEKAIKAALFLINVEPPKTHDIERLIGLLPAGWQLKRNPADYAGLSEWAVESRYPGEWQEATEDDAKEAVRLAREVWEAINSDLRKFGILV